MNVQEYIASGVVESYVLGLATEEEQLAFEQACARYPEVRAARETFELALEKQMMASALKPPPEWKQNIVQEAMEPKKEEARVVPMRERKSNPWKFAAAAAALLLVGSLIWNLSLINKNKRIATELASVNNSMDSSRQQLADMQKAMDLVEGMQHVKMANMKGMDPAPEANATVYWDSLSKDVYLLIHNLPLPASDKQYQLWALLDGKPIDLGVIPNDVFVERKRLLLTMKNTIGAQAFAITLEKMGGNPTPEGQMYTLGNL